MTVFSLGSFLKFGNPNDKKLLVLELIKDPYIKAWLKTSIVTGIHHQTMVEMAEVRSKAKIQLDVEEEDRRNSDNSLPPLLEGNLVVSGLKGEL